ncbi:hypothetical protein ACQR1I_16660 [Bradyrhizobium sp. HKCCYLS2038]|uniref:hypothetical protein n=1 Tax=unclassified Bradyrhizobium TaxID=2631580 RepID=UPI003EBB203A
MIGSPFPNACDLSGGSALECGKFSQSAIDVCALLVGSLLGVVVGSAFVILLLMRV